MFDPQPQNFINEPSELERIINGQNHTNDADTNPNKRRPVGIGEYVLVQVTEATPSTLYTNLLAITTLSTYATLSANA